MSDVKLIAMYLPQYHPTPNNDIWWGKGFTEWINVARAKPLFHGHEQPHIPGELGFYDLRLPETREAQATLAKEYGIYGFCYYYYRFSKGNNELDLPIKEILRTHKPDFPFMLCWANQSWNKKFWKYDGTCDQQILAEQKYGGDEDYRDFFYEVLPYFKDERYIKIDGKVAFMIHKPKDFENVERFITIWQQLAVENGLKGIHFIGYINGDVKNTTAYAKNSLAKIVNRLKMQPNVKDDKAIVIGKGFDAVNINRQYFVFWERGVFRTAFDLLKRKLFKLPYIVDYKDAIKFIKGNEDSEEDVYPTLLPNWDHTPRSSYGGQVFVKSTPDLFKTALKDELSLIQNKDSEHKVIFIKAWNEWGEGNYLEPDAKWGRAYLEGVKEIMDNYTNKELGGGRKK